MFLNFKNDCEPGYCPVGFWCQNDFVSTSFYVMCPLGGVLQIAYKERLSHNNIGLLLRSFKEVRLGNAPN